MRPPETIDVLDQHGGFTAETTRGNTLWRPGKILARVGTIGKLVFYTENSFYQQNNNVTRAEYKVKGYRYPVMLWFDNTSGERIA